MGIIYEATKQFMENDDWPYVELETLSAIKTGFEGQTARWDCFARPIDEDSQLLFYSLCPVAVPRAQRPAVMEYITRANYGLRVGNFEMNIDDGEVRYKTSLDLKSSDPEQELIRQIIYANVLMMDQYLPGLLSVVYGDAEPLRALQAVEGLPEAMA